jgi:excisionase family DNA binding protein
MPFDKIIDFNQQCFTINEAAEHLRVSRALLYKHIKQGKLKPFKIGARTLIRGSELDRFVQSAQQAAQGAQQ